METATTVAAGTWRTIALLAVSSFAFLLALDSGRRGFQPLDHSIVFDAAHRLQSGQRPAIDFEMPVGLVPALLQEAFFRLFGTNWWSYCLHGALANAVGAGLVFVGLAARARNLVVPLLMGAGTAVVLVPPIGVPFPDPWSMLFSIAALVVADRLRPERISVAALAFLGAGALFGLAFLSKPIPALFALPPLGLVLLRARPGWRERSGFALALALGCAASALVLASAAGTTPELMWQQFVLAALPIGRGRLERAFDTTTGPAVFADVRAAWAVPVLLVAVAIAVAGRAAWSRSRRLESGLALALVLGSISYALLSLRHALGSLGWYPLALGLALTSSEPGGAQAGEPRDRGGAHRPRGWRPELMSRRTARALVTLAAVAHLARFQTDVNLSRVVNLIPFEPVHDGAWSPRGLEFLDVVTPAFSAVSARGISGVLEFLEGHPGSFYLLGDASILYGLSGRPSSGRTLWFHPWVTIPWHGSVAAEPFQKQLIRTLGRERIRYVVVEGTGTHLGVGPDSLPRVRDWVDRRGRLAARADGYRVIEIGARRREKPAAGPHRQRPNRRHAAR